MPDQEPFIENKYLAMHGLGNTCLHACFTGFYPDKYSMCFKLIRSVACKSINNVISYNNSPL